MSNNLILRFHRLVRILQKYSEEKPLIALKIASKVFVDLWVNSEDLDPVDFASSIEDIIRVIEHIQRMLPRDRQVYELLHQVYEICGMKFLSTKMKHLQNQIQ
jgi:hypothetical protein